MNTLEVFRMPAGREVRTLIQGEQLWFVAGGVYAILGFRMASAALRWLNEEEQGYAVVRTPGGGWWTSIVNVSGLYAPIFRSRQDGRAA